jgi:hypothetical protein
MKRCRGWYEELKREEGKLWGKRNKRNCRGRNTELKREEGMLGERKQKRIAHQI